MRVSSMNPNTPETLTMQPKDEGGHMAKRMLESLTELVNINFYSSQPVDALLTHHVKEDHHAH